MGKQVLKALEKLHRIGFCHSDLKLDNICFKDGHYFLIDFACAQRITTTNQREKTLEEFKGNLMFASSRKLNMNPQISPSDDIESLFYLIFFCLNESKKQVIT